MILQKQPANYGWPYCYVPGKPYADWDYVDQRLARLLRLQQPRQRLAEQPRAAGGLVRQWRPASTSRTTRRGRCGGPTAPTRPRRRSTTSSAAARWPARATSTTPRTRRRRSSRSTSTTATSSSSGRRTGCRPSPSTPTARSRTAGRSCRSTPSSSRWTCSSGRRRALRARLRQRLGRQQRRHRPVPRQLRGGQPQADGQGQRRQGLRRRAADGQLRRLGLDRSRRGPAQLQLGLHQRRHARRHHGQGHPHLHHARRGRRPPDRDRRQGRLVGAELPDRGRQHPPGGEDRLAGRRHADRARPADDLPGVRDRRRGRLGGRLHQGRRHALARAQLARASVRDRLARAPTARAR